MVVGSRPTLQRMVQIQRQQAELLKLKLLTISTRMAEQHFQIRQLQQSIADASGNDDAAAWSLANRSLWIQRTQQRVADCHQVIHQLEAEHATIEAERQQIERKAEATQTFVDEQLRLERSERHRLTQIELNDNVLRRGTD